ncbi:MAG TPA: DUF2207 domain-containing protein [Vicinamibacterales bacterium]
MVRGLRTAAILGIAVIGIVASAARTATAQTDRGAYEIRNFETTLTVEENSDLLVEERIDVFFQEPRHGIFRTIPVRYSDPKGYAYSLGLRLLSVTGENGASYEAKLTNEGRYVKIRIGDPDRTVEGAVTYVIRYRVRDALTQFPEHDEIYWNATGHEWNATIARSSATVRLPGSPAVESLRFAGYTGAFGMAERAVEITHPAPGVVRFVTTRPLGPLEGLTIAVGFPQGLVTFPSAAVRAGRIAADNWIILLPFGWLVFLFRRYRVYGRDPEGAAVVMVRHEPPTGLTPGDIGTLIDERVDTSDITATVVDLAVRRYLTIRIEERDRLFGLMTRQVTVFSREPEPQGDALKPHERSTLMALFATGDEVEASDLANRFYRHIPGIQRALYDRLVQEGYFAASPEKIRTRWKVLGMVAAAATGAAGFAWMSFRAVGPPAEVVVPILAAVLTFLAFAVFSRAMPRRTRKGVEARGWALGFQEFATRVEGDRLERAAADPRLTFERLLPYAMALGIGAAWAKKFEGVYAGGAPAWYVGQGHSHGFSTRTFEQDLSGAMSSVGRSMTASPRSSSGSGGGGSSGGGGGGGGGGSW